MGKSITVILFLYLVSTLSCADSTSDIKSINQKVAQIEKNKDKLDILSVKLLLEQLESSPPEAMFYYNPETGKLAMAKITVGHETFSTTHSYYFNKKNKIIKYLK